MTLPTSIIDREKGKFVEDQAGDIAIRTRITDFDGDINVNAENNSISTTGLVGKASGTNADFTTAYASGTTLTCSSLPSGVSSITADDVISITQVATDGSVTKIFYRGDETITASGTDPTTLTVSGASFAASDTFVVITNIPRATINDAIETDDSAYTAGSDYVMAMGGFATSDAVDSGDIGALAMTTNRELKVAMTGTSTYENSAFGETEDEASASEFVSGVIYGLDTEGSSNSQLRAIQVAADNASVSATPNVLIGGGIFKSSSDTYNDNDAVPFHFDSTGNLKTSGAASVNAEYRSPTDFTATFTSNTTITLSGLPFTITDDSQIVYIKYIPTGGSGSAILVNGAAGVTITESSNVLTVDGAGTPFASGDVYEVGINAQTKGYDLSLDSVKVIDQSPPWSRYTDPESVITSAYELTSSFADVGGEIDVRGYTHLTLWFTVDIGTSTNPQIRVLHKHTSAGSEEYREIYLGSPSSNITAINLNDYEVNSDSDQLFKITLPVTGTHFVQVQAKDDANGDGQIDALYATKSWGSN